MFSSFTHFSSASEHASEFRQCVTCVCAHNYCPQLLGFYDFITYKFYGGRDREEDD